MGIGSGVSRGDRNRNARLEWLRVLVPVSNAIVGIGLAGVKQMVVVTGHDSKVIARRVFRCRAWVWAWRWTGPASVPLRRAGRG
jgi:transposase